jgi:geranylgeranyl diphosphate synthase type II
MDAKGRVERALDEAVAHAEAPGCPPRFAEAIRYAVFPGGARIRPRLALATAWACGDDTPGLADAAAAAIELLHCASLVHDDMPCFDDADMRRGKPSVHAEYGESLALLTGDALIIAAFETLGRAGEARPERLVPLVRLVSRAVGAPGGICAGQAWECEAYVDVVDYHRAKTGALFAGATMAGAAAAGHAPEPWRALGEMIGEAFQVADDIRDATDTAEAIGKPVGRDAALGRPNAVRRYGLDGAVERLTGLVLDAVGTIPACPGQAPLRALILHEVKQFLPKQVVLRAA